MRCAGGRRPADSCRPGVACRVRPSSSCCRRTRRRSLIPTPPRRRWPDARTAPTRGGTGPAPAGRVCGATRRWCPTSGRSAPSVMRRGRAVPIIQCGCASWGSSSARAPGRRQSGQRSTPPSHSYRPHRHERVLNASQPATLVGCATDQHGPAVEGDCVAPGRRRPPEPVGARTLHVALVGTAVHPVQRERLGALRPCR